MDSVSPLVFITSRVREPHRSSHQSAGQMFSGPVLPASRVWPSDVWLVPSVVVLVAAVVPVVPSVGVNSIPKFPNEQAETLTTNVANPTRTASASPPGRSTVKAHYGYMMPTRTNNVSMLAQRVSVATNNAESGAVTVARILTARPSRAVRAATGLNSGRSTFRGVREAPGRRGPSLSSASFS